MGSFRLDWLLICALSVLATHVKTQDETSDDYEYRQIDFSSGDVDPEDLRFYHGVSNPKLQSTPLTGNIVWKNYMTQNYYGWYLTVPTSKSLPDRFPTSKRHYYMGFNSPNYAYPTCGSGVQSECRFLVHCAKSEYFNSFDTFLANACPIGRDYIGVCCPKKSAASTTLRPATSSVSPAALSTLSPPKTEMNGCNRKGCGVHCNKVTDKIVGGRPADPREWPWMVAVLRDGTDRFCGGVLITDQHVLTAAHCVFPFQASDLTARIGEYDFRVQSSSERDYSVERFVMHENYERKTIQNDIALLKLNSKVKFSADVSPVCLPDRQMQVEDQNAYVTGWGVTSTTSFASDVLLEVIVPIRKQNDCRQKYAELRINITDNQLCAGGIAGKDACQGDSGGPLMFQNPKTLRWQVVGLVSYGKGCGEKDKPGVYTRVSSYENWIKEKVFSL